MKVLETRRGALRLPAFLPDGTRAVVRGLDATDLKACGIEAMMVNALHLSTNPGTSTVAALGGVHRFMGWDGIVASDSGGFQAWSLAHANAKLGSVTDKGFVYRHEKKGPKHLLTPEKCIRHQLELDTDILFCLDQCTHPDDSRDIQETSVARTIAWAKRCRDEYIARVGATPGSDVANRPLLFAVVQGGNSHDLRTRCADQLADMGFDGFGFGGWPIAGDGGLTDMVARVVEMLPESAPKHALGIGKPDNIVAAWQAGYQLFDCAIATRDARRRRLYVTSEYSHNSLNNINKSSFLYVEDERYARDELPLDPQAGDGGPSRAYLHHLFKIKDHAAERLATKHNLAHYTRLIENLRDSKDWQR